MGKSRLSQEQLGELARELPGLLLVEGARVMFTGRDQGLGKALEADLGKNTRFMPVDVANETEIAAMVAATVEHFGGLDCLVSNAGGGDLRPELFSI